MNNEHIISKMITEEIIDNFEKLSDPKKVEVLFDAINYMNKFSWLSVRECICLAMGYEMNYDDNGNDVWKKTKSK